MIEIWVDGDGNKMEQVLCEECQEVVGWINEGEEHQTIWCGMCCPCDMKYGEKDISQGRKEAK